MLAGDEQDVAETLPGERLGLAHDFIDRERHAQDRVVA